MSIAVNDWMNNRIKSKIMTIQAVSDESKYIYIYIYLYILVHLNIVQISMNISNLCSYFNKYNHHRQTRYVEARMTQLRT